MQPFEELESVATPDGRQLTLRRHAGDYYVDLDGRGLMSTRTSGSEEAMAEVACEHLAGRESPRVLIGGLGLGYTLTAALDGLPPSATVVVAEVFPVIVEWNRQYGFGAAGRLDDPRLVVLQRDVVDVMRDGPPFDAILLDVDNGPDAWCLKSNERLYSGRGLMRSLQALTPGGLMVVWSAQSSPQFADRLKRAGFAVETRGVRARGRKGARHTLFMGVRRDGPVPKRFPTSPQ